jgi:ribosomal protein S18 acetylase RimI-like enzyme
MNAKLRPCHAADLAVLERWYREGDLNQFMSRWGPRGLAVGEESSPLVAWWMIAAAGGEVGAIWMERVTETAVTVDLGIFIALPEWRGKGLGKSAMRLAEKEIMQRWGTVQTRLRVRQGNAGAIACYEALGYRTVSAGEKFIDGEKVRVWEMVHDLCGNLL